MMRLMHLRAKDVSKDAITIEPEKSLRDVRKAMLDSGTDRIVVVTKESLPIGIITEKNLVRLVHLCSSSGPIDKIKVGDVMSTNLITIYPESNLSTCLKVMIDKDISSLIITDEKHILRGILTKIDVISSYSKCCTGTCYVRDFMTKNVSTVAPCDDLSKVLSLMADNNVSRIIVTKNHRPIGIITDRDIMSLSGLADPYFNRFVKQCYDKSVRYNITKDFTLMQTETNVSGVKTLLLARDIMKPDPVTVTSNLDLADAVKMMLRNGIHGLPVVDSIASYVLVGVVTKTDAIRAMMHANR